VGPRTGKKMKETLRRRAKLKRKPRKSRRRLS
jgi:hypothetical protein